VQGTKDGDAREDTEAHRADLIKTTLGDHYKAETDAAAAVRDYAKAADMQQKIRSLETATYQDLIAAVSDLPEPARSKMMFVGNAPSAARDAETFRQDLSKLYADGMATAAKTGDYATAAEFQQRLVGLPQASFVELEDALSRLPSHLKSRLSSGATSSGATAHVGGRPVISTAGAPANEKWTVSRLVSAWKTHALLPDTMTIDDARLLSVSKLTLTKGKGKGKGKGKTGKFKSKRESVASSSERESCRAIYVADNTGATVCCLAFGAAAEAVPLAAIGHPVQLASFKTRPGQKNTLYMNENSRVVQKLEVSDGPLTLDNFYRMETLATVYWVHEHCEVGDYVDLFLRVQHVEPRETMTAGEPYVQIYGTDSDGASVGPLRLWRFSDQDVRADTSVVIRGLKIAHQTAWDEETYTYASQKDKPLVMECSYRTSVEDVSHLARLA